MLSRIRKSMADKDQGFTLIELLVVIIILGILAAISIPVFLNQRKKGVDASIKSDIKNAATMVETWATDNPGVVVDGAAITATLKSSPGNVTTIYGSTTNVGAYCISSYNPGADAYVDADNQMPYKSSLGGFYGLGGAGFSMGVPLPANAFLLGCN